MIRHISSVFFSFSSSLKKERLKNNVKAFPFRTAENIVYAHFICCYLIYRRAPNYELRAYEIAESDRRDVKVIEKIEARKKPTAENHWWKFIWPCTTNRRQDVACAETMNVCCTEKSWSLYDLCVKVLTLLRILQPAKLQKCAQKKWAIQSCYK